jgi:hypothetical protein
MDLVLKQLPYFGLAQRLAKLSKKLHFSVQNIVVNILPIPKHYNMSSFDQVFAA